MGGVAWDLAWDWGSHLDLRERIQCLRNYRWSAHFRSKLTGADSEAAETQSWLEFALRCGYITEEVFDELDAVYEKVSGGLVNMMANADQWCISSNHVREDGAQYELTEAVTPTNPGENNQTAVTT